MLYGILALVVESSMQSVCLHDLHRKYDPSIKIIPATVHSIAVTVWFDALTLSGVVLLRVSPETGKQDDTIVEIANMSSASEAFDINL